MLISQLKRHTLSYEKSPFLKECNWFEHMIHPGRHSGSLSNWTGRMKACVLCAERFQIELYSVSNRGLVCVR